MGFKIADTTADTGILVWAKDLKELFEEAARGLFHLMYDPNKVEAQEEIDYESEGIDPESTLISMLNDIIFLHEAKKMVFKDIKVSYLNQQRVRFTLYGEKIDPQKHEILSEIKAATMHNIAIEKDNGVYRCRIIFDV